MIMTRWHYCSFEPYTGLGVPNFAQLASLVTDATFFNFPKTN